MEYKGRNLPIFSNQFFKEFEAPLLSIEKDTSFSQFKPIRIVPVDIEFNFYQALLAISLILKDNVSEKDFNAAMLKYLMENNNIDNKLLYHMADSVINHFHNNIENYKSTIADDFALYKTIINALEAGKTYDSLGQSVVNYEEKNLFREKFIYDNIKNFILENKNQPALLCMGLTHVIHKQDLWLGLKNWQSSIENLILSDQIKVCRIYSYFKRRRYQWDFNSIDLTDIRLMDSCSSSKYTLFSIKEKNSPFDLSNQYILFVK